MNQSLLLGKFREIREIILPENRLGGELCCKHSLFKFNKVGFDENRAQGFDLLDTRYDRSAMANVDAVVQKNES